ncbi:MAG: hypothetical protein AB1428_01355 [Bacteroidota bacterium]
MPWRSKEKGAEGSEKDRIFAELGRGTEGILEIESEVKVEVKVKEKVEDEI